MFILVINSKHPPQNIHHSNQILRRIVQGNSKNRVFRHITFLLSLSKPVVYCIITGK